MQTEHKVCKELQKWFRTYDIECWLNQDEGKFVIKGTRKKPDLIIYSEKSNQYIILEVKVGDVAREIHDASKILEYYKDYTNGISTYFVDGKEIVPSSFAVATFYSMFGRLFKKEGEPNSIDENDDDGWKYVNKKRGIEPYWEYQRTHDYTRRLWSEWRKFRTKDELPGVGVLLADNLNLQQFQEIIGRPLLFDMQRETIKGKRMWKVRQKKL